MSKADSKTGKYLGKEFPEELSGLLQTYHDRVLVDDSLADLDVLLLSIYLTDHWRGAVGAPYDAVKELFVWLGRKEANFRVKVHLASKDGLVAKQDTSLHFLAPGLKRLRKALGQLQKMPVYVIKSGESFTAVRLLEQFLASEIQSEDILLCDPHVAAATLFPFSVPKGKVKSIKILTSNVYDATKFRDYAKRMHNEMSVSIEVRTSNLIHDRYLISGAGCWSIGASIKDLGNKDTIIREISEVAASMTELFKERWDASSVF